MTTLKSAALTLSYLSTTDPTPREYFSACLDIAGASPDAIEPAMRAECLRGLAIVYANIDSRYDEADQLLREAVAIQRTSRGSTIALSSTLQMLGLVNRYRGRFADDELAQREAYEITSTLARRRQHRRAVAARGVGHEPVRRRPARRGVGRFTGRAARGAEAVPSQRQLPAVDAAHRGGIVVVPERP